MLRYMPKPVPAGIMWPMITFSDDVFHAGGFVDFLADGDADDEVAEVDLASPTPSSSRVLANLVAHRENGGFPMIGKKFSNGLKKFGDFSNDWENFSRVFQRLEKLFYRNEDSFTGSVPLISTPPKKVENGIEYGKSG